MNRRKLGSSRKSKGRQHVKEPETEQELEPRKDVQEETWGIATLQTQVTARAQLEMQEESGQGSEYTSAKCVTSLVSAPTHAPKNESSAMSSSEGDVEIIVSKDSDVQDCKFETTLKVSDKSTEQNEETKDRLFEITNDSACLSVNQQTINIKEKCSLYFVAESDSNKKADTDLFSQDERFQGKFSVSESHIKIVSESTTPEKTVDNATNKVNREIKNIVQEVIVLPKEELATNEGKVNVFKQINVRDVQYPAEAVTKVNKDNKPKEVHSMDQIDDYPGSLKLQSQLDSDLCFENTTQSDLNAPSDPQQDKSSGTDGQTDANFSFTVGRRKLGSSRRNKDRQHVEKSEEKVKEHTKGDEAFETQNISLQIRTERQKELTQDTERDYFLSISHDSSMSSMYLLDTDSLVQGSAVSTKYAETDPQSFMSKYETLDETQIDVKQEIVKTSEDIAQEKVNESDTQHNEDTKGVISEGTPREMQEAEILPVQMQENLQTDHSLCTGDGVKPYEMVCKNLPDYAEISKLTVKNMDQSTIKHVYPTKEDLAEDAGMENESILNAMSQLTEKNMNDFATVQEKNLTTDDQTFYQEKEVEGDKLKLSRLQSETVFVDTNDNDPKTIDEQLNTGFDKKDKRKRLGSKRRKRLRSLNESKQDLFVNIKANESPETTPISLETTAVTQKELKQDTDHEINQTMSHDSSENVMPSPEHSAKIHISVAKEYPELDLESFNSKRENAPENLNGIDTYNNAESDKLRDTAPVDESDSFLSEEVITPRDSVKAVGLQVLANLKTQVQESLQIVCDTVTNEASENLKIVTGNPIDQSELVNTYQSGFTKKGTDDSVTNQKVFISDDEAIMSFTVKGNTKDLVHRNKDNLVNEPEETRINKTEREDTALIQIYEDEGFTGVDITYSSKCSNHQEGSVSEFHQSQLSDLNAPSDNQLQEKSLSTDEQTEANFNFKRGRRQPGPETERCSEPRKNVKEKPRGIKTLQTQVSEEIQPEMQEQPHQESEYDLPVEHDASLVFTTTCDFSEVKESTPVSYSKEVIEITARKDNSMQYCKYETKLEETHKNSIAQSEEIKESAHDYFSELDNLSVCPVGPQIINQEGIFNMDVSESESKEKADSDLFLGNYSLNKSHVKTCSESPTVEMTADNSTNKDRQIRHDIKQAAIMLPKEELATNKEKCELFKLPNMVRDVQYSEKSVNKVDNKNHNPTKVHSMDQAHDPSESLKLQAADGSDLYSDSLMPEIYQPENMMKSADVSVTKYTDSAPDGKLNVQSAREEKTVVDEVNKDDYVHETKQTWINKSDEVNIALSQTYEVGCPVQRDFAGQSFHAKGAISEAERNDICVQSPLSDLNDYSNPLLHDKSLSMDEKTGANFSLNGNTRKLGLRRERKGGQRVRDSEIEQEQEPRKNVQEESSGIKILQAQASEATQLKMQEEDESQYSTSAECDTSLVLDFTHDFSEFKESSAVSFPEDEISKDETNLEETDKSNTAQNVETKQNTHECLSELPSFSECPSSDQQTINKREEFPNVYVSDELETNKNTDTNLFRQDESFQGNYSVSESHVKTDSELTTPQITADNSTNIINRKTKDSIEQVVNVLPKKELALSEEKSQLFKLPKVRYGQYSQDVVDKVDNEGNKLNLWSAAEENLGEEDTEHFTKQSSNQEEVRLEAERNNITVQSLLTDIKTPSEPQLKKKSQRTDEQTDVDFSFRGSTRKLGSSRKYKEKQLGNEFKEDNEALEGPKTPPKPDTQSLILRSKNLQKDQDEEKDPNLEMVEKSLDDTREDEDKSDTSYSEDINVLTDSAQLKREEVKVHLTQMPESLQIYFLLQNVTGDGTESCEVVSESLTHFSEISALTMKTIDDDNEENPTEENISKALELKHDNSDAWHMNTQQGEKESAVSQVYEFKDTVEDETEPKPENIFPDERNDFDQTEGTHSASTTLEYETVLFDSDLHKDSETADEQTNRGANNSGNRKKMSSRRNKGRQLVKEEKENIVWNNQADEAPKTIQMSLKTKAGQEILKQDIKCDISLSVSHDISMFSVHAPAHSSDIQSTVPKNNFEPGHKSFVTKSENPQEKTDEKDTDINVKMFNKSGETTPPIATRQEEVIVDQTTQILEDLQIDYSSDTMTDEAPFNPEVLIGRLNEQIEIYNKNFKEKITHDSVNIQEVPSSDDIEIIIPTVKESLETVMYKNEDDHVHQPEQTLIYNTEREISALSQTDEGEASLQEDIRHSAEENVHLGVSSEAERNNDFVQFPLTDLEVASDPQLQDKSQSTDKQTDANLSFSGSKRKLGSSRRNKGRHRGKESKEDVIEITKGDKVPETLKVSEIKPTKMEEISQDIKQGDLSVTYDDSMSLMPLPGHSSDVQSSDPTTHPETIPQSLTVKSDNLHKDQQTTKTEINMRTDEASVDDTKEGLDQSETCHNGDIRNVLSADVQLERQEDEVDPTQMQESLQIKLSSETVTLVDNESCEVVSGPLNNLEKISKLKMKSIIDVETKQKSQEQTTTNQEELKQDKECDIDLLMSHDSSMFAVITPGHSSEVHSTVPQHHPEPDLESFVPKSESPPEQIILSTVEESLETVMYKNEDDRVHQPEQTLIYNTEREISALSQTDEGEASLQEDIRHSAEKNVRLGVSSEAERNNDFVQSPITDVEVASDPQLQDKSQNTDKQTDANLSFSGSRRKLGSSRRNKGRHCGKESKEDVIEITKGDKVLETLKVSEIKPTKMEEISQDIKQGDLSVTYDDSMSLMPLPGHSSDVQSSDPTTHPETIPQSLTVKSDNLHKDQQTTETEINMRTDEASMDDTKEGLDQSETCHNGDIRNVLSADVQLERQEDEVDPTQIQESLQIKLSSETVKLVDNESCEVVSGPCDHPEEIFELTMKCATDYETTQKYQATTIHQDELKQDKECDIDLLVSHDSSMFAVITPGHSSEVHSTVPQHHPEPDLECFVPKSESPPGHPDESQTDYNLEMFDKSGKATAVNKSDRLLSQDIISPLYTDEGEAPMEKERKDSVEQNVNLQGVSSEVHRNIVYVQSSVINLKAPTDPQPQDQSLSTDEQTDSNLSFSGSRRKLGSSRRNKGRHRGKESKDVSENTKGDEVIETTPAVEMKTSEQDIKHDFILSVSHANTKSLTSAPSNSSEIQSSASRTHPEIDSIMLIPKTKTFQEDLDVRMRKIDVGLVKQSMDRKEDMDRTDNLHSEDTGNVLYDYAQFEGKEVEVHPTQMPESLQIDFSLQTVKGDGTECCEVVSELLADLTEISDLTVKTTDDSAINQQKYPTGENISEASDLKHDNSDLFSMIKQQFSDLKEVESSESLVKDSNDRAEDYIKLKPQHVLHQEKKGLFLDTKEENSAALSSETVSFDSQPQNESITVGDQTNSDLSKNGNKRKMGSSRRNKGRQQIKEFKKEVFENTKDDTALETTVLIDIKTTEQKEQSENKNLDNVLSVSQDSSMSLMASPDHSSEVQSSKATNNSETETQILILGSQNLEEAKTEKEPEINVKMVEESVGPMQQEIGTFGVFHSHDLLDDAQREVQKVEKHSTQMQRSLQINSSSEGFKGDATEMFDISSENVNISEQKESFTKENEVSDSHNANEPQISALEEVDSALRQAHEFKDRVEVDINPKSEQTFHQEQAEFSTVEENKHVLSTLQSENVSFDSQPKNDSLSVHEQTNMEFHNSGSRRKLGSSRRTKGRHTVKDSVTETYNKPIEDEEKEGGNKLSETTLTLESTGQKEDNLHTGAFDWTSELASVGVHSASKADEKVIDKPMIPDGDFSSKSTELSIKDRRPEEKFFVSEQEVCPVTTEINTEKNFSREEVERKNQIKKTSPKVNTSKSPRHTEDGVEKAHKQEVDQEQTEDVVCDTAEKETGDLVKKTEIMSRNIFYSTKSEEKEQDTEMFRHLSDSDVSATPETTTEKSSYKEHTEVKCSVEQEVFSSPHDNLPKNKEQDESNKMCETTETLLLEDIGIKDHEKIDPEQMQDMHHVDLISLAQNMSSVQTLQPHANVALDSDSQDNYQSNKDETHSGLRAAGSRRKMGSSRRIKGRQNAKFTEADQEHQEEDVETTENDAATQMIATKTITPRESKDLKCVENFETISSNEDNKAEKELGEKSLFLHEDLNNQTVSTLDIITSSDKEDTNIKPSEDTKEKHVKLARDLDDLKQLPGCDTDKNSLLMQSPEGSVSKGASDMQSILHHDDIIISEPGSVSVPEQEEAIQHQSRGAGTLEEDVELRQTNKVTETVGCVASESSSTNVQDPELEVVGEKRVYADQEIESISASEEPPVDVSFKSETSTTMDFGHRQEKNSSDFSESFEAKSKQKKKKFGSSRRTPVTIKQERETHNKDETKTESKAEDGMMSLEKMKVVKELPSTIEGVESENVQPSHGDLVQQEVDEAKTTDSDKHRHVKETEEQKPGNTSEGIHSQTVEVKSESPDFHSTNRRRIMGSTPRNLGSRSQRENMDQEEELEIETTGGDTTSEKVSEILEEKLQAQAESKKSDSDQRKEKVFETAAISHVGEALLKPVAEETPEESPVSPSQDNSVSEAASGGRRKKFGSNRKSHLQQRNRDQNESEVGLIGAQNENHAGGTTEEGPHKAAEQQTDKSSGVEKTTKVDKNDDEVSANISISETKVPVSEATPRKLYLDENSLGQEGQLSFAGTNKSNSYNVVLVGESSVGKSSFMKRALSGKFALDIPASVGLDSCKWTVVVDGKPVLLQLWDTAGQERFHSITRHIFHKAQAFLLMYDITSSQSFSAVSYWANCIQESAAENVTVLLLGNKSDHAERQVKTEQGDILAKEYNFGFMECSAASGQNVIEALETVARMLNQRSDLREEATVLEQRSVPKRQSRCC